MRPPARSALTSGSRSARSSSPWRSHPCGWRRPASRRPARCRTSAPRTCTRVPLTPSASPIATSSVAFAGVSIIHPTSSCTRAMRPTWRACSNGAPASGSPVCGSRGGCPGPAPASAPTACLPALREHSASSPKRGCACSRAPTHRSSAGVRFASFHAGGSSALLVLGFESSDHPVDEAMARALALCAEHGGKVDERRAPSSQGGGGDAVGSWRSAFIGAPYVRDTLVAMGVLAETFETAITWERFPASPAVAPSPTTTPSDAITAPGMTSSGPTPSPMPCAQPNWRSTPPA
jgi:hypothetical protein